VIEVFTASRTLYQLDRARDAEGRTVIDHGHGQVSTAFEKFEPVYHLYRDCTALAGVAIAQLEEGWMPIQTICEHCRLRGEVDLIDVVAAYDEYTGSSGACIFPDLTAAAAFVELAIGDDEGAERAEHLASLSYEPRRLNRVQLAQLGEWEP